MGNWVIHHLSLQIGRFRREGKGQSVVELAVLMPIVLILLVGVVEVGFALYSYMVVVRVAHEGARVASDGGNDVNVTSAALLVANSLPITTTGGQSKLDIYVIRGSTDVNGTIPAGNWVVAHTQTSPNSTTPVSRTALQASLVPGGTSAKSMRLVVIQVFYSHESLFGFNIGPFSGSVPMSSYTVQRDVTP